MFPEACWFMTALHEVSLDTSAYRLQFNKQTCYWSLHQNCGFRVYFIAGILYAWCFMSHKVLQSRVHLSFSFNYRVSSKSSELRSQKSPLLLHWGGFVAASVSMLLFLKYWNKDSGTSWFGKNSLILVLLTP